MHCHAAADAATHGTTHAATHAGADATANAPADAAADAAANPAADAAANPAAHTAADTAQLIQVRSRRQGLRCVLRGELGAVQGRDLSGPRDLRRLPAGREARLPWYSEGLLPLTADTAADATAHAAAHADADAAANPADAGTDTADAATHAAGDGPRAASADAAAHAAERALPEGRVDGGHRDLLHVRRCRLVGDRRVQHVDALVQQHHRCGVLLRRSGHVVCGVQPRLLACPGLLQPRQRRPPQRDRLLVQVGHVQVQRDGGAVRLGQRRWRAEF